MAVSEEARRNHDALFPDHVLIATLTQLLPFIGYPRTLNAIQGRERRDRGVTLRGSAP